MLVIDDKEGWLHMPVGPRVTIDTAPPTGFHYRIAVFTGGGKFIDGYTLGVLTIALAVLPSDFGLTPFYAGLIGAAALFGLFLGSLFIGPLADKIGRIRLYQADLILFLVAALAQFFVTEPVQLFFVRLVLGIAIGIDYAVGPTYLSEMLPQKLRAPLLGGLAVVWNIGYLVSIVVGYVASQSLGGDAWKWVLVSSAVPTALVMLLRLGTPESPRWLVKQGRHAEAEAIVKKYIHPEATIDDLVTSTSRSSENRGAGLGNLKVIFSRRWRGRALFSGFFWIAQATPQTAIFTFMPSLFIALGLSEGLTPTLLQNIFLAAGGVVGMLIVNRFSRRKLLISTFWAMAVSIMALAVLPSPGATVVIVCLAVYSFIQAISANLQFIYPSELFPTSIRAAGVGTAAALSRVGAAIGTFLLPIIIASFGVQVLMIATVCLLVLGALVSWKVAPETSGRGLDQAIESNGPVADQS